MWTSILCSLQARLGSFRPIPPLSEACNETTHQGVFQYAIYIGWLVQYSRSDNDGYKFSLKPLSKVNNFLYATINSRLCYCAQKVFLAHLDCISGNTSYNSWRWRPVYSYMQDDTNQKSWKQVPLWCGECCSPSMKLPQKDVCHDLAAAESTSWSLCSSWQVWAFTYKGTPNPSRIAAGSPTETLIVFDDWPDRMWCFITANNLSSLMRYAIFQRIMYRKDLERRVADATAKTDEKKALQKRKIPFQSTRILGQSHCHH